MYLISATCEICSSHVAPGPDGLGADLHGHNFKVAAYVEADQLGRGGWVLPPEHLREELWAVLQPIDHRHLNDLPQLSGLTPTPEVLARWIYEQLEPSLRDFEHVRLRRVEVWQSPTSCQAWEPKRGD